MSVKSMVVAFFLFVLLVLNGCGDSDETVADGDLDSEEFGESETDSEATCDTMQATLDSTGLTLSVGCGEAEWLMLPAVQLDGQWYDVQTDTSCEKTDEGLSCAIDSFGKVLLSYEDGLASLSFSAEQAVTLNAFSFTGHVKLPGARAWLSNGFQSWSQSGMIALNAEPTEEELDEALAATGNTETVRSGKELSWWYTAVGGGEYSLFAGAVSSQLFKSWLQAYTDSETSEHPVGVRLVNGSTGEAISLNSGDSVTSESWRIWLGKDLHATQEAFGRELPSRRKTVVAKADAGWNSWYELWDKVTESDVQANAAIAKTILQDQIPSDKKMRIVVDDGWQQAWGEWTPNEKFPSGMNGLADDMHQQGFEIGVWLAPLLVDSDSDLVTEHPDWFVTGSSFGHPMHGDMRILDVTQPDAAAHLAGFIQQIVSWGYDFLKIDFLFAGTYEGGRSQDVTGMQAYHQALSIIREAAGEEVILLAVGAPPTPSFEHVDAWRLGPDIAFEQTGANYYFIVNEARAVSARYMMCYATLCDPDPPLLRTLPQNEVDMGAWVVAFGGGGLFLSDNLPELDEARRSWGLTSTIISASLSGEPSVPEDLFPAEPPDYLVTSVSDSILNSNHHVLPLIWRLPDGTRVAFNPDEQERSIDGVSVPAHHVEELQ